MLVRSYRPRSVSSKGVAQSLTNIEVTHRSVGHYNIQISSNFALQYLPIRTNKITRTGFKRESDDCGLTSVCIKYCNTVRE